MKENKTKCLTKNRIVVQTYENNDLVICPKPIKNTIVEVFSDGWSVSNNALMLPMGSVESRSMTIEYITKNYEDDYYTITWLELTRR